MIWRASMYGSTRTWTRPGVTLTRPAWWAPDSPINAAIPASPVIDANSAAMVANLTTGNRVMSTVAYSTAIVNALDPGTTRVDATGVGAWAVDVPVNPAWVPPPGSDGWVVVVDPELRRHWCLWQYDPDALTFSGGGWGDPTAAITTVNGTATGANFLNSAGLVRIEELARGRIDHALVFATDVADNGLSTAGYGDPDLYRFPATRTDAQNLRAVSTGRIPEGARLQLDPATDISSLSGYQRTIAEALKTYGAYCVDNGASTLSIMCQKFAAVYPEGGFDWEPISEAAQLQGITTDYLSLSSIPWGSVRVLASWDGS